jgi:hypothetical protein
VEVDHGADDLAVPADTPPTKRMRLRYAGLCRDCGKPVAAGEWAVYYRLPKNVQCLACAEVISTGLAIEVVADESAPAARTVLAAEPVTPTAPVTPVEPGSVITGTAGASARREHERRAAKREARIRTKHPRLGGLIMAMSDEPQHTQAWARGARGEELLAKRLDALDAQGVLLLHDRRIPPGRSNIDHIAISAAGIFVIDAKRYQGRPSLRVQGGILRPRTETLLVGRRDCTKLIAGITKQVGLVRAAIATTGIPNVPVHGMLCFVEADWPLIGGSFATAGIDVLWPKKATERVAGGGSVTTDVVIALHRHLATEFPIA